MLGSGFNCLYVLSWDFFFLIYICLFAPGLSCSTQDLPSSLWHVRTFFFKVFVVDHLFCLYRIYYNIAFSFYFIFGPKACEISSLTRN